MFNRVKGTQDILDMSLFNYLIKKCRSHLALYNFSEISTPILEHTELFTRSLGQETDVVTKEMYEVVTSHDNESICLRPEGTAGVVRAFVNNNIMSTPWKVFAIGPMFRHERPQKGRLRQFNQITMEIIGSNEIESDVQCLKMLDRFFSEVLNLDNYALIINFLGCPTDRVEFKKVLHNFLEDNKESICQLCIERKEKNILRVLDCKTLDCRRLYASAPKTIDHLCNSCQEEWLTLKNQLELLCVSYSVVPSLVRGLDYYDKTVFEFVSEALGAQSAFCSGGRYNQLAKEIGSKEDQPSIGAAIGVERLLLLLENSKLNIEIGNKLPLHLIIPFDSSYKSLALLIEDELIAADIRTDVILDIGSIKSMMRKADKIGAKVCLLIGETEVNNKEVTLKFMDSGLETRIPQVELIKTLKKAL